MAKTVTIEFGAWEPDAALLNGHQAPEALNVIPAKRGYRPMPGLEQGRYGALAEAALEVFASKDMADDMLTIAATSGHLYALEFDNDLQQLAWVSRWASTPATDDRYIVQYGGEIYALFGSALLRQATAGTAFEAVTQANNYSYDAPTGARLGIIRDFLMVGNLTSYPNGVQWSGIDRPDYWPAPGSNAAQYVQSDRQIFPVGGAVQSIVGAVGGVDGLIFLERAIQRATYVGPPYFFQFDPVDTQQGTVAPKSPVVCGTNCFYLSEDGWKATDGAGVTPIGNERVDRWFADQCDPSRIHEVRGVHDSQHRLAVWSFPTSGAPAGTHNRLLIYSYALDKWSYANASVECLFGDYTRGMTLEELDSIFPQATPVEDGGIDTLPPPVDSLDSAQLKNGLRILGGVSTAHKLGAFTGSNLEAVIDTAEYGGERMMVHGFRPLVDCGNAYVLPICRSQQRYQRQKGEYAAQSRTGVCYHHVSCDYVAAQVMVPAETEWRHAVAVEALIEQEGGL